MSSSVCCKTVSTRAVRPSRSCVVVRASAQPDVSRRAILGACTAVFGALLAAPQQAQAIKMPWQESTGGMLSGGGSVTKSSSGASMEGYTLEGFPGTKKPSYLEPSKKRALRSKAREDAIRVAGK